jgi:hypothetical protein
MTNSTRYQWRPWLLLISILLPTWGCVSQPKPKEVLAYGFDTPIQAFQSFVVALRADLPHYEYRCFSSGFKKKNEISRGSYLMFRDQLLEEQPLMRWALQRASRNPADYKLEMGPNGKEALLTVNVRGRSLQVVLARESFVSVLGQPQNPLDPAESWVDKNVGDLEKEVYLFPIPSAGTLGAQVPHPNRDLDKLISLTVGREWKIEDIYRQGESKP